MKPLIAVTGKNGQLGWELERLSQKHADYQFIFCDRDTLDITDEQAVQIFFEKHRPSILVNCAAYTAVDKAEVEQGPAYRVNAEAVGTLAIQCKKFNTAFITFSTDYVFNGNANEPYKESDDTDPVNYYGYTKLAGEQLALQNWERSIIIRTSWVYSTHGHNFVKTMLRLMKERSVLSVVSDQFGSPTYAKDLAEVVMVFAGKIISGGQQPAHGMQHTGPGISGIFHFSNEGMITWFDFAKEIARLSGSACELRAIATSEYPTPAKRPAYSVLDKTRIVRELGVQLKDWKNSLATVVDELQRGN